ncbi:MAG: class beta-lactamase, partial [Glaciihabitans sp.]|nr:class beta-lactamase [Glaciihabitans sp.]
SSTTPGSTSTDPAVTAALDELEARYESRLGVWALDTATGREVNHRSDERFAYASTYKALAAAAVLRTSDDAKLAAPVPIDAADIVSYSPVTSEYVGVGLPLSTIAEAAVAQSDNTAGNLLLDALGGPDGLDAELALVGDTTTRVDRWEPELNTAVPGDLRDTSTPNALGEGLQAYLLGDELPADRRALLTKWMTGNSTGAALISAGVPEGWTVADKSGAANYGTRNDIAVLWPPGRDPIVLAILSDRAAQDAEYSDAQVAEAAAVVTSALS